MTEGTATGLIRVMCGVHSLEVGLAGKAIVDIRRALAQPLNIDPRAVAVVNGAQVAETHVASPGDQVEFVRLAGEKGRGEPPRDLTGTVHVGRGLVPRRPE